MIVIILSIIDIIAALVYFLDIKSLVYLFALFSLFKGIISMSSSFFSGYFFDWMGVTDFLKGIVLILFSLGIQWSWFDYVAWAMIFKGVYSIIRVFIGI